MENQTRDPPQEWLDAIAEGDADFAAGRIEDIDLDDLIAEIEAEADELETQLQSRKAPFPV